MEKLAKSWKLTLSAFGYAYPALSSCLNHLRKPFSSGRCQPCRLLTCLLCCVWQTAASLTFIFASVPICLSCLHRSPGPPNLSFPMSSPRWLLVLHAFFHICLSSLNILHVHLPVHLPVQLPIRLPFLFPVFLSSPSVSTCLLNELEILKSLAEFIPWNLFCGPINI